MFNARQSMQEMTKALGRSRGGIESRLDNLGLLDRKNQYVDGLRPWTSRDTQLLKLLYQDGVALPLLAERFECSKEAIRARLFYLGLSKEAPHLLPSQEE